jgi:hypothetical protein
MAELTVDERIEKIAIECLELLENGLKDKSSHVLERYKETVENPQDNAYQQARRRII